MKLQKEYYLGLDIGTDSVGYAVTDEEYKLLKFKGEPMWGSHVFEAANQSAERRAFRTARRRLDRRQQRVQLLEELFAEEIGKVDPRFFIRRKESALYREDSSFPEERYSLFNGNGLTDPSYYKKYPTVHHLICDLMENGAPHDVRLVFLACAWLVAHRGHFLSEVDANDVGKVTNFHEVYAAFSAYFTEELAVELPWSCEENAFAEVMQKKKGVTGKEKDFLALLFGGKKPKDVANDGYPVSRGVLLKLLCGGKVKANDLFRTEAYEGLESFSLGMPEEALEAVIGELGDDGELVRRVKGLYDWALLVEALRGKETISRAKVEVYEQHKKDLRALKAFIRKYIPGEYKAIFREAGKEGYTAYSGNTKSVPAEQVPSKLSATKDTFCDFLKKKVKGLTPAPEDAAFYTDMLERLETRSFLPKQKDSDNRVIPHQLYQYELTRLLGQAERYLPFLAGKDEDGLSVSDKILSVFTFRVPYFVGPLNAHSSHAWLERKAGNVYPWNFEKMVDLEESEKRFIDRMTNYCTYLPGEEVLPKNSLLYCKFTVLNEINNIRINGAPISVEAKQRLYAEVFETRRRVSVKNIRDSSVFAEIMKPGDTLSGLDISVKSSMKPLLDFARLLASGQLTRDDVENVIRRITYTEDKPRLVRWLRKEYPHLSKEDVSYISRLDYSDFGRLSSRLLDGLEGTNKVTGEVGTVMHFLWETNDNLMQILEGPSYTFAGEVIPAFRKDYYADHPRGPLAEHLDEMYVSNAVKRPIIRTLAIVDDVVKATGRAPAKIFVEMARGATEEQKNKRTSTRLQTLRELYAKVKTEDARQLSRQLDEMGDTADNRLQSEALYLYYLQLGKCMYTGASIDVDKLRSNEYNIDHIYPQCFVKDDSLHNNKVLVLSTANGKKGNSYPVPAEFREKMHPYWETLKQHGLITEEKYKRLTRTNPFTEEEKLGFINRQLVETRQSTKAVTALLEERYPGAKIVYVKAGLVSDFRHEFDMLKCREINDLHHAKDAYLNIVTGNVYTERFTNKRFLPSLDYSIKTRTVFERPFTLQNGKVVWAGEASLALVRATMAKNSVHFTRYAFCRKGGLFNQQPEKAAEGLVPRKKDLPTEKYGGYNNTTASFFMMAAYEEGNKKDVMLFPVELMYADKVLKDDAYAKVYAAQTVSSIIGKPAQIRSFPLGLRPIKINTMLNFDGFPCCIASKYSGGKLIGLNPMLPLMLSEKESNYVKKLISFCEKKKKNASMQLNQKYDEISMEDNCKLYRTLSDRLKDSTYHNFLSAQIPVLEKGSMIFNSLACEQQVFFLLELISLFKTGRVSGCDLSAVGGSKAAGVITVSSKLSNWKKSFKNVSLTDSSPSGLFSKSSPNLLDLV